MTNPPLNATSIGSGSLRRFLLLGLSVTLLQFALPARSHAQEEFGSWDGALWQFTLIPVDRNPHKGNLRGRFRVEKLKMYQGESGDDKEMKREVGESVPAEGRRPTHTRVTLTDFRARGKDGKVVKIAKVKGKLERDDKDHNHGKLIADDGFHWEIKCTRIQD